MERHFVTFATGISIASNLTTCAWSGCGRYGERRITIYCFGRLLQRKAASTLPLCVLGLVLDNHPNVTRKQRCWASMTLFRNPQGSEEMS